MRLSIFIIDRGRAPPCGRVSISSLRAARCSCAAEAERIFRALAQDGTVQIPIAETFWALRFGMLVAVASAQKKRTLNSAFKNNENNVG